MQTRQRWCSEETLASFNSCDFRRDCCCQGEARFETRGHCQSCCSFSSKLTSGWRRRLRVVHELRRRGVEREGGEGAAVLCTVLWAAGACHCQHHRNPGGERGAWNRCRRAERCVVDRGGGPASPSPQPLRGLRSKPPPSRPPSSRASGCRETGSPGGFYHTLNPHTFHSSPSQQLSIGSWERPENKGGGAESAPLKERGTYCLP